jgi:hypothetical protein
MYTCGSVLWYNDGGKKTAKNETRMSVVTGCNSGCVTHGVTIAAPDVGGPVPNLLTRGGLEGSLGWTPDPNLRHKKASKWVDGPYPVPNLSSIYGMWWVDPVPNLSRHYQGSSLTRRHAPHAARRFALVLLSPPPLAALFPSLR